MTNLCIQMLHGLNELIMFIFYTEIYYEELSNRFFVYVADFDTFEIDQAQIWHRVKFIRI